MMPDSVEGANGNKSDKCQPSLAEAHPDFVPSGSKHQKKTFQPMLLQLLKSPETSWEIHCFQLKVHGKIYQLYQILPNPNEFQLWFVMLYMLYIFVSASQF